MRLNERKLHSKQITDCSVNLRNSNRGQNIERLRPWEVCECRLRTPLRRDECYVAHSTKELKSLGVLLGIAMQHVLGVHVHRVAHQILQTIRTVQISPRQKQHVDIEHERTNAKERIDDGH